jgi:hypothetical protein
MAAVSETITREFFELKGFLVRQHRKYIAPVRIDEDEDIDFFILNPHVVAPPQDLPFILNSEDLSRVHRAIVVVKGWHTETFSQSRLTSAPEIFRFVEPKTFQQAARAFGEDDAPLKILIVPSLPHEEQARRQSIELLKTKGVDAVIPFRTMLQEIVSQVEPNRNYQKSDFLQVIRILKNYDFLRDAQMELFKPGRSRKSRSS